MTDDFDNRVTEYTATHFAGIKQGAADIGRHAIADIGDKYQEILMGDASVSPPSGLTSTMETVTYQTEQYPDIDIDVA